MFESFGTVGDCFDNAVMEAFWGRLQTELLNTKKWSTTLELTAAMADHIDNFHNAERGRFASGGATGTNACGGFAGRGGRSRG